LNDFLRPNLFNTNHFVPPWIVLLFKNAQQHSGSNHSSLHNHYYTHSKYHFWYIV
jgi:hypothetical protein